MKGRFNNKQSACIILYTIVRYIITHERVGGKAIEGDMLDTRWSKMRLTYWEKKSEEG